MLDIDDNVTKSSVSSFADDTRVSKGVKAMNDAVQLQSDLLKIYDWADENKMVFNNLKFELLLIASKVLPTKIVGMK